jgi:hypothetical protein
MSITEEKALVDQLSDTLTKIEKATPPATEDVVTRSAIRKASGNAQLEILRFRNPRGADAWKARHAA